MKKNTFALLLGLSLPLMGQAQDAKIKLNTVTNQLQLEVSYKDKPVILPSSLGFNIDNQDMGENVRIESVEKLSYNYKIHQIPTKDKDFYYLNVQAIVYNLDALKTKLTLKLEKSLGYLQQSISMKKFVTYLG